MSNIEVSRIISVDDEINKIEEINLIEQVASCLRCSCEPCRCRAKSLVQKSRKNTDNIDMEDPAVSQIIKDRYFNKIMDHASMLADYSARKRQYDKAKAPVKKRYYKNL